jgi:hypothetical protein
LASIKLSESLIQDAKSASKVAKRTLPEQIEHWAHLGKAFDENPNLPVHMLQDILVSREEMNLNKLSQFRFG